MPKHNNQRGGMSLTNTTKQKQKPNVIETEFGDAFLNDRGYYTLFYTYEPLHRVMYTKYNKKIPQGYVIHHLDGDKTNNNPSNLIALTPNDHSRLHKTSSNPATARKISYNTNTTGYRNVTIQKDARTPQGFFYCYQYYDDGKKKRCSALSIPKLEQKVMRLNEQGKHLPWEEF